MHIQKRKTSIVCFLLPYTRYVKYTSRHSMCVRVSVYIAYMMCTGMM